ncbi:MAG: hypothetical protein WAU28_05715 [Candidatus Moraniibacteriota bacterium]
MKPEIIEKINSIVSRSPLEESHVQHLFTLVRKLIEKMPETKRKYFSLLKFYCDWTLHSKIDNSKEGALIVAGIHNTIARHLTLDNNESLINDLNSVLSFSKARDQLNNLILESGGKPNLVNLEKWTEIITILAEIISQCPLEIGKKPRFSRILKSIRARPLKGTSGVERLSIIKIPKTAFDQTASANEITFNLLIDTTDTTKFVVPLVG